MHIAIYINKKYKYNIKKQDFVKKKVVLFLLIIIVFNRVT